MDDQTEQSEKTDGLMKHAVKGAHEAIAILRKDLEHPQEDVRIRAAMVLLDTYVKFTYPSES